MRGIERGMWRMKQRISGQVRQVRPAISIQNVVSIHPTIPLIVSEILLVESRSQEKKRLFVHNY